MPTLAQILEMLERNEALDIGAMPDVWPTLGPDEDVYELDWTRLFPGRVLDRGSQDWEVYGNDQWELPPEVAEGIATNDFPVSSEPTPPGWDRCAWYQPIHFHGTAWGIFIYDECIIDVARGLYVQLGRPPLTAGLAKALVRAAFATLFLHEQYHHKTESFAIRLHVVEECSRYVPYFRGVYVPAAGTDDQVEEGLANADSYHRLDELPYRDWLGRTLRQATKDYLFASFGCSPPGYRLAAGLLDHAAFDSEENLFEAQVQEARLKPVRASIDDYGIGTYLNQSLFSIRQNIWTVAAKGAKPLLPARPSWILSLSRAALEKHLRVSGFMLQDGRGKGAHRVYTRPASPMVVLPDRSDLSPVVLRNTAHALGLKNVRELLDSIEG